MANKQNKVNRAVLRRNAKLHKPHGNRKGAANRFKTGPQDAITGRTQTATCGKRDSR